MARAALPRGESRGDPAISPEPARGPLVPATLGPKSLCFSWRRSAVRGKAATPESWATQAHISSLLVAPTWAGGGSGPDSSPRSSSSF